MHAPRLIISALAGGSGKTLVSLGLARAFTHAGLRVKTYKKGPDYIDAAWLAQAAGSQANNLDPYFSSADELQQLFGHYYIGHDIAVIEGNRGLFDGTDLAGSSSTAELARTLKTPVVIVLDCTKMTRTAAALIAGCIHFDPTIHICGVILNRTGSQRHRDIVTAAIETFANVPVFGALPRSAELTIAERSCGLPRPDSQAAEAYLDSLGSVIAKHIDIKSLQEVAENTPSLPLLPDCLPDAQPSYVTSSTTEHQNQSLTQKNPRSVRIGYIYDEAFWYYYTENLDALQRAGADLIPLSLLDDIPLPELDGLYIGGGNPELFAEQLAANSMKKNTIRTRAINGLPLYAEGGGCLYLADTLEYDNVSYPMVGIFPVTVQFSSRPKGLGYTRAIVTAHNPFFTCGDEIKGHEFHFSSLLPNGFAELSTVLTLSKGHGLGIPQLPATDGLTFKRVFASSMYLYAPTTTSWAQNFIRCCSEYKKSIA